MQQQMQKPCVLQADNTSVTNNNFECPIDDYLLYFTAYVTDLLLLPLFFDLEYSGYSG